MMQPRVDVKMGDAAEIKESKRTFIVPAIKSFDHYDFTRAKISSSLTWLIAKAFGSGRWCLTFSKYYHDTRKFVTRV